MRRAILKYTTEFLRSLNNDPIEKTITTILRPRLDRPIRQTNVQQTRILNRCLTRIDCHISNPLTSEKGILQAAHGGAGRRKHIPTIITGCTDTCSRPLQRLLSMSAPVPDTRTIDRRAGDGDAAVRQSVLVTPPRRSLLQTRRLVAGSTAGPSAQPPLLFNIGHINARSLIPRLDEVNILLDQQHLDILCISETWLRPDITSRVLVFPGYTVTRCDRASPPGSRGARGPS